MDEVLERYTFLFKYAVLAHKIAHAGCQHPYEGRLGGGGWNFADDKHWCGLVMDPNYGVNHRIREPPPQAPEYRKNVIRVGMGVQRLATCMQRRSSYLENAWA